MDDAASVSATELLYQLTGEALISREEVTQVLRAWQQGDVRLAVLDLHRAQIHRSIPEKWLLRDLAALLFSTLDLGLSRRAWLRFVRIYRDRPLQEVFAQEGGFWARVQARAEALYAKGATKGLVDGSYQA